MKKNIPPVDGKNYYFNEVTQAWLEVQIDEHGFELTPERIQALKPHDSWVRNSDNTAWIPPVPQPIDEFDENGNLDATFAWNEVGGVWDRYETKPFPSWVRNSSGEWVAPVERPADGLARIWREDVAKWVRDPESFGRYSVFWDTEELDFVDTLGMLGFTEDRDGIDASFEEQKWPSWVQGEDGRWRAPVKYPVTGKFTYEWDEYEQEWFDTVPEVNPRNAQDIQIHVERMVNAGKSEQGQLSNQMVFENGLPNPSAS